MATKGERAKTALKVLMDMLNDRRDIEIAVEAGRMSAVAHFAGYLSTRQVNEEISICAERVPGFTAAFLKESTSGS